MKTHDQHSKERCPARGIKAQYLAPISTENSINVQSAIKYALGIGNIQVHLVLYITYVTDTSEIEWEEQRNLYGFLLGPEFQAFGAKIKRLQPDLVNLSCLRWIQALFLLSPVLLLKCSESGLGAVEMTLMW